MKLNLTRKKRGSVIYQEAGVQSRRTNFKLSCPAKAPDSRFSRIPTKSSIATKPSVVQIYSLWCGSNQENYMVWRANSIGSSVALMVWLVVELQHQLPTTHWTYLYRSQKNEKLLWKCSMIPGFTRLNSARCSSMMKVKVKFTTYREFHHFWLRSENILFFVHVEKTRAPPNMLRLRTERPVYPKKKIRIGKIERVKNNKGDSIVSACHQNEPLLARSKSLSVLEDVIATIDGKS